MKVRPPRLPFRVEVAAVVAVGALYVIGSGWAMANTSYDIWGALRAAPLIAAVMVPLIHVSMRRQPHLVKIVYLGLALKAGGTVARYWVAFDAYGGAADAQSYHDAGRIYAQQIRDGQVGPWSIVPHGTGTEFVRHLTGTLYTVVGSSKLGGFLWFSALGYVGVILCIKAADYFPQWVDARRYAWLCCLSPSLVFWPSSIGKESWMMLSLGLVVYGAARLFATRQFARPILYLAAGTVAAGIVRPHMATVWVGAGVAGVVWSAFTVRTGRGNSRGAAIAAAGVGVVGLIVVGRVALRFLPSSQNDVSIGDQINTALDATLRRTSGGGSEFTPPSVASPLDYPVAVLRTITRPLPYEVRGLSTLLPAVETAAIIVLALVGISRMAALPSVLRRSPLTVMHLLIMVATALAYTSFSNLAILVRQRSLLMPSLLFLLSVRPHAVGGPEARWATPEGNARQAALHSGGPRT